MKKCITCARNWWIKTPCQVRETFCSYAVKEHVGWYKIILAAISILPSYSKLSIRD